MGLKIKNPFKRGKKISTSTTETSSVQTKIVKFSYIETLAIDGGLSSAKDLSGETESTSSSVTVKPDGTIDTRKKTTVLGGAVKALGTTTTTALSGWTFVKSWKQPQFDIIRYVIGIKELSVVQFKYEQVSEIVSKPWTSPKEISKVVLYVDQYIPKEFPASNNYIEYYVKPDIEDTNWVRINGLGLPTVFNPDNSIVPRIISFNTEKPINSNLEESYIATEEPVKSIRFKAVLRRPDTTESGLEAVSLTPILKSYKLLMTPKNGL